MKKLISLIIFCMIFPTVYGSSLQKKTRGFFDKSITINNNSGGGKEEVGVKDNPGGNESVWNIDFGGMDVVFPNQPAYKQIVSSVNSFGATYKFSEQAHFFTRYSTFVVDGVELEGVDTQWQHEHIALGYGLRFSLVGKTPKQLVVNLGVTRSKINELAKFGTIPNLEMGIVADIKYLWVAESSNYGINLTVVEVESTAETFESYHKGGYMSIGFVYSVGIDQLVKDIVE